MVSAACFSQTARIPLTAIVLDRITLDDETAADLSPTLLEFIFDICNKKNAVPKEDRTGRDELVRLLLTTPSPLPGNPRLEFDHVEIDAKGIERPTEGSSGGTLFSKACYDGDIALLRIFVELLPALAVAPSQVLSDGTTPLHMAVFSKNVDVVRFAAQLPGADAEKKDNDGNTPVSIAQLMQNAEMQAVLEAEATV